MEPSSHVHRPNNSTPIQNVTAARLWLLLEAFDRDRRRRRAQPSPQPPRLTRAPTGLKHLAIVGDEWKDWVPELYTGLVRELGAEDSGLAELEVRLCACHICVAPDAL